MSPTSGEQLSDPQASTSTEPLKLELQQTCNCAHMPHAHTHLWMHVCPCTHLQNWTISIPLYCNTQGHRVEWIRNEAMKALPSTLNRSVHSGLKVQSVKENIIKYCVSSPSALIRVNINLDYNETTRLLMTLCINYKAKRAKAKVQCMTYCKTIWLVSSIFISFFFYFSFKWSNVLP